MTLFSWSAGQPRRWRTRSRRRRSTLSLLGVAALIATLTTAVNAAPGAAAANYPFQNPKLSLTVRVDDLMNRLTLDEKISLLHESQAAIPRLDIPYFKIGTEALHGVAWSNDLNNNWNVVQANGTVFPQAVGLASTWDTSLINQVGSAVGDEARGFNAENPVVWGLNLWAPVVNLLRDPRWGRNEEGYSEDPTLTSAIATAYGKGMEGNDPTYLKAAPTLKHYLAYNNEAARDVTSSNVPPRVLNEYDRKPFEGPIAANAATGVMASYNLVNGRPDTVNPDLATTERSWTDQTLFNVTDAYAPYNLTGSEHYFSSNPEAFAAIIKAGVNGFTIDNSDASPMIGYIKTALAQGLLTAADIDKAVRPVLTLRMRLGQFDPDGGPYAKITPAVINSPAHQQLNRKSADEAMVLLKNSGQTLPLNTQQDKKIAVIGPLENTLYSDWYGGNLPYAVTPLEGIKQRVGSAATVTDSEGSDRIALKDTATGKYVTVTGTTGSDTVKEIATTPTVDTQFDVVDWGQDVLTLKSAANGHYLGFGGWNGGGPFLTRDTKPNGWYVQQQFKLEPQIDGSYLLHYYGYETRETWWGQNVYVKVDADGSLDIGPKDQATHFTKEVVKSGVADAVAAASGADAAVVVVGSNPFINAREAHDRTTMALSAGQEALIKAVYAANPNTIVVLETSYPDTITWEQENVPAILWTTHAGDETGHAVADVLFGDYNPAGRLTQTWYRSDSDLPPDLSNYDIISSDQTYLYYRGAPLYPFGYGLSYTSFGYSNLRVNPSTAGEGATVHVGVDVTNTGTRAGDEVVQLYTHQRTSRDKEPIKQLHTFQRVTLQPGQTKRVNFSLPVSELAHWDVTRSRWVVETSDYDVMVGASSADIRQHAVIQIDGETIPARDLSKSTRAENFDAYSGAQLVDESKAAGTAVGSTADGQWISYRDAAVRGGTFTASVSKGSSGEGTIEVRLDSPTGPLLGTATVPSTGDVYTYVTTSAPLATVRGVHDVYLVLSSGIRISTFTIR